MSTRVLRLSEGGRRIYATRRSCGQRDDSSPIEIGRKRRVYVDGTRLQRANSAYVERVERVSADELY